MQYTYEEAKHYTDYLKKFVKGLYTTGSVRRKEPVVNDFDFITKRHIQDVIMDFMNVMDEVEVIKQGLKMCSLIIKQKKKIFKVDIWRAGSAYEYFFKKLMHDINAGHAIGWKNKAKKAGYELSDTGLRENGILVDVKNKSELKRLIGL